MSLGTEPLPPVDSRLKASWDLELVPRMRELGRVVFEEQVLESLLEDLSR